VFLGKRLIKQGRKDFGRLLIAKGFQHDISKFYGIEWKYLHAGNDIPKQQLDFAIEQHVHTNSHHPEYWGSINNMPEIALAEMVCDWYARSQEFGTSLMSWYIDNAIERYEINESTQNTITKYINALTENSFVK
jgi:hypothetical protein